MSNRDDADDRRPTNDPSPPHVPTVPHTASASRPPRRSTAPADQLTALSVALVLATYVWVLSAGTLTRWPSYGAYYSDLADGFAAGHLYLTIDPDPRLLALPDPYDPAANAAYRTVHDAILFRDRLYLYWGPVPALVLLPGKLMAAWGGWEPSAVGDQYLTFAFAAGLLGAATLLLARARARLFPAAPAWAVGFGVLVVGLANPLPYTLARAAVYEAAILGGQSFLMAGTYFAYRGLFPDARGLPGSREPGRPRAVPLAAAAACWSLAVGCRLSLAAAVAALGAFALVRLLRPVGVGGWRLPGRPGGAPLRCVIGLALPAATGAVLLGIYNQARFGSWAETGWMYQLASISLHRAAAEGWLASPWHVPANLLCYLAEWPRWDRGFPFVTAANRGALEATGLAASVPAGYNAEPVAGVLPAAPVLWLAALAAVPALWRRCLEPVHEHGDRSTAPLPHGRGSLNAAEARWLVLTLAAAGGLGFAPVLFLGGSTMRYLADLSPSLGVLAAVGVWLAVSGGRPPRARPGGPGPPCGRAPAGSRRSRYTRSSCRCFCPSPVTARTSTSTTPR
jgi:hypothetical protein